MQNNVDELYSLIKFLRIKPLNDWPTFRDQISEPVKKGRPQRAIKRLHVCIVSYVATSSYVDPFLQGYTERLYAPPDKENDS